MSTKVISWQNGTAIAGNWVSVAYGSGLYVAVSYYSSYRLMTSTNGLNWTLSTFVPNIRLMSITYGNGVFVAVGDFNSVNVSQLILTSTDGYNWTYVTSPLSTLFAVLYANNIFVATGKGATLITSIDGTIWSTKSISIPQQEKTFSSLTYILSQTTFDALAFGNNIFMGIQKTRHYINILVSSDGGLTWNFRSFSNPNIVFAITGLCFSSLDNLFYMVFGNNYMAKTFNGTSLTFLTNFGINQTLLGNHTIAYGNDMFVIAGNNHGLNRGCRISYDGNTWDWANMPGSTSYNYVGFLNNTFIGLASGGPGNVFVARGVTQIKLKTILSNFSDTVVKTYGDPIFSLTTPTSNRSGTFTFLNAQNQGIASNHRTAQSYMYSVVNAGSTIISVIQEETTDYSLAIVSCTLTVNKATTVLSNFNNLKKIFGDASFNLVSPTTNNNSVAFTYSSSNTSVATISGSTVTIISTGSTNITATQVATANYTSATITCNLIVDKGNTVLSNFIIPTKTYGDANFTLTAPISNRSGTFSYISSDPSVATVSGNLITIVGVGNSTITAIQDSTTTYNAGTTTSVLTVNKKSTILSNFNNLTKTYGDNNFNLTPPTSDSNGLFTYLSSNNSVAIIYGSSIKIVGAGSAIITATQQETSNNTLATITSILTVNKGTPLLTNFNNLTKTYGDIEGFELTNPISISSGLFTYSSSNDSVATISGNNVVIAGAGLTTITATQDETSNYNSTTITSVLTILKAPPLLSNFVNLIKTINDASFTLNSPTSNSNGLITYTSSDPSVATISTNGNITILKLGFTTITATQEESTNYTSGTINCVLFVNKEIPVLANFDDLTKMYGDMSFSLNEVTSNSSGLITYTSSDPSVAIISGNNVTIVGAGSTIITAMQKETDNYSLSIITRNLIVNKKTPSLSNFNNLTKVFSDNPFSLSDPMSSSDGLFTYLSSNSSVATIFGNTVTIIGVGSTIITATQEETSNYNLATITCELIVNKTTTELSNFDDLTKSFSYGTVFSLSEPISNRSGLFTYSSSNNSVATVSENNVTIIGAGTTIITVSQLETNSHTSATITSTLTVNKQITILSNFNNLTKTIVDNEFSLISPISNSNGTFTYSSSNSLVATISGNNVTIVGDGFTVIEATQEETSNFTLAKIRCVLCITDPNKLDSGINSNNSTRSFFRNFNNTYSFTDLTKIFGNEEQFTLTAPTSNSDGAFSYSSSNPLVATISGNLVTIVGAGYSTITAVQEATSEYNSGIATIVLTVNKATPLLDNFNNLTKTYGDNIFSLTPPTSNSDGLFNYLSSDDSVAIIYGSSIQIVGAGSATITAIQEETLNYSSFIITSTLTVDKEIPTLSNFNNLIKTYGDVDRFTLIKPLSNSYGLFTYSSSNNLVATIYENDVLIDSAGSTIITATQEETSNYTSKTLNCDLIVNKAIPLLSNFNNLIKKISDISFTLNDPMSNSNGTFTYTSSNPLVATVSGINVTILNVGFTTITATQQETNNYTSGIINCILTINKGDAVLGNFDDLIKNYEDVPFNLNDITSNSDGLFTYISANPLIATISGNTVTIIGAGSTIITAVQEETDNYFSSIITRNLIVNKKTPLLSNFNDLTKNFSDEPFVLDSPISASDGLFTYSSSNNLVATISGNAVTIIGVGSATITATQQDTSNYNSATTTCILTVNKTITELSNFDNLTKIFSYGTVFTLSEPISNSSGSFIYSSSNSSVATIFENNVTIIGAGSAIITASQEETIDYTSALITSTLTVNKGIPTLSNFDNLTKTYSNIPFILDPPTSNSNGTFTYSSSNSSVATISGNNVTIVGVGSVILTASQEETSNYTSSTITCVLNVNKQTTVLSNFNIPTKTYGDASFTLTPPTSNSNGTFSYSSSNTSVATISGNNVTIVGAGSSIITVSQLGTANYTSETTTATLTVNIAATILSNFNIPTKTYGDISFTLDPPTSNSDGTFTYSSSNTSVATISGNNVTIVGAGSSIITASQSGTSNYTSATTTATLTVNKQTTILSNFIIPTKTYGDASFTLTPPTSNSNGTFSYSSSNESVATISGNNVTIVGAGSAIITASQLETSNYTSETTTATLTVNKQSTVLSNFNIPTKTYGDISFTLTPPTSNSDGTFTYSSSNESVTTISGNNVTIIGAGNANIIATQLETSNYTLETITSSLTVNKQTTVLSNFNIPEKIYGDEEFSLSEPTSNRIGSFTYSSSNTEVATISGNNVTIVGAGSTVITVTQEETSNYTSEITTSTLIVNKKTTVLSNFSVPIKTYGDLSFTLNAPISNSDGIFSYSSSNSEVATISGNNVTIVGAGSSIITVTQEETANYTSETTTATLTVNKQTTVLSNFIIPIKTYGDASFTLTPPTSNSNGTFSYSSSNTEVATISGNNVTIVGVGSSIITVTQGETSNYTSETTTAILTVNKQTTILSNFNIPEKIYGDVSFTLNPPTSNSDGTFSYSSSNKEVATISGNNVTIVGTGSSIITVTQGETSNYTSETTTAILTVNKQTTVLSNFNIPEKIYGDEEFSLAEPTSNSSGTFSYSSLNTEVATIYGNNVTIVGAGSTVITVTQEETSNYTSAAKTSTLIVNKKTTVLGNFNISIKTYGDLSFTLNAPISNSDGIFSYSSSNSEVATISGNNVTIVGAGSTDITVTQEETSNYTSAAKTSTLIVNKKTTVLGNFNIPIKTYGDLSFTLNSPISNSDGTFSYLSSNSSVATISGNNVTIVGAGSSIITVTQGETSNYTSETTTATLIVNKQTTVLSNFNIPTKTYGDASFTLTPPTSNSDGTFIYSSSNTEVATISGNNVTIVGAGNANIIATQLDTSNYTLETITSSLTVKKQTTVLSNFNIPVKTYGDNVFSLSEPTSNSSGTFSYSSLNTEVATISGNNVTIIGAGSTIIIASQQETSNYTSEITTSTLIVNKKTTILSNFSVPIKTYGDGVFTLNNPTSNRIGTFSYSSSNTEVATISGNNVTIVGPGSAIITATQGEITNYTSKTITSALTVNKKSTILSDFYIPTKTYGDSAFSLSDPMSNRVGSFSYSSSNAEVATISGNNVTIIGGGTTIITATQEEIYDYYLGTITYTLTVFQKIPQLEYITIEFLDGEYKLSIKSDSNGSFSYSFSDNSVVKINSDNTLTFLESCDVLMTAHQSETNNYYPGIFSTIINYNK